MRAISARSLSTAIRAAFPESTLVYQTERKKANIINGTEIASSIRAEIAGKIVQADVSPGLAVIQVGKRPDSEAYVRMKHRACIEVGIRTSHYRFPEDVTQEEVLDCIEKLNRNQSIHGILVQLPLPVDLNSKEILMAVHPLKDVDGLHPLNQAKFSH